MGITPKMVSSKQFLYFAIISINLLTIYYVFKWTYAYNDNGITRKPNLIINADILDAISISNDYDIQLFLVEFDRLVSYVSDSELNRLKSQIFFDSMVNVTNSNPNRNRISFGFFGHAVTDTRFTQYLEKLKSISFQCFNNNKVKTINFGSYTLLHDNLRYNCQKGDTYINLIKFMKRNDYYWFIESNDAMIYTGIYNESNDEFDSEFVSAFDAFNLTICSMNDVYWYIPYDLSYFMAQTKSSRFVSCDTTGAIEFRKTYPNLSDLNFDLMIKIQRMIISLKKIMMEELKQCWILGGTLLGWYRQCGLQSYTNDIDFATWHHYASQQFTERLKHNKHGLTFKYIFGFIDEAYENSFMFDDFKLDLFYNYEINKTLYAVSTHSVSNHTYSYYYHQKYEICSTELLDIRVNVPCNPRDIIIDTYGKNWWIPVEDWNWYYSPFNKGKDMFWDYERIDKAFQQFDD